MKKKRKLLLVALELLGVLALLFCVFFIQKRAEEQDAGLVSEEELARRYRPSLEHNGESCSLKRNMSTLLLMGTDNFIDDAKQHEGLTYNYNLADFLVILAFDNSAKTVTPYQICRDTMCDVTMTSGRTERMQITLAHTYFSGGADSCENVRNAAEGLLYGLPIDNYLAFTMDTVPLVNNLLGGITVTLEDDFPALGPEYVKGASITLKGSEALRFVRYRDTTLLDDNLRRMANHRLYLSAVTEKVREASERDQEFAVRMFESVQQFINTDLSVETVTDMLNHLNDYTILPAVTPEGKYQEGERFAEFIVDDASQWACVRSVFCAQ